jgi:hypothetical protein
MIKIIFRLKSLKIVIIIHNAEAPTKSDCISKNLDSSDLFPKYMLIYCIKHEMKNGTVHTTSMIIILKTTT